MNDGAEIGGHDPAAGQRLAVDRPTGDPGLAVVVGDVGKVYRLYGRPEDRLKEQIMWRFGRQYGRDFWALSGVSFSLGPGERLGIIGRNGSGKSTLLQIIAGTLAPSTGTVQVRGRVAALLELGSGFNPQFTGRENVLMNATLLGLSPSQISARFDGILAFADIGSFVDQPVKTYSTGMLLRLAFSVATAVDADVLLVDEALAVGDIFFRQKCYGRLEELRRRGTAVVLVSHAMTEIEQFCDRALLLDRGRPVFLGPAVEAVSRYYLLERGLRAPAGAAVEAKGQPLSAPARIEDAGAGRAFAWPAPEAFLDLSRVTQVTRGGARCTALAICDRHGRPCRSFRQGQTMRVCYEFELRQDIDVPIGGVVLRNDRGIVVHGKNTIEYGSAVPLRAACGTRLRFVQDITLSLAVGEYTISPGLACVDQPTYERRATLSYEELNGAVVRLCHLPDAAGLKVTLRPAGSPVQLLHHGIADLPGSCLVEVQAGVRSDRDAIRP